MNISSSDLFSGESASVSFMCYFYCGGAHWGKAKAYKKRACDVM
jgi:hypothetical protein